MPNLMDIRRQQTSVGTQQANNAGQFNTGWAGNVPALSGGGIELLWDDLADVFWDDSTRLAWA